MSVEWRLQDDADSIVLVETSAEVVSEVLTPDAGILNAYLAVTGNLQNWRRSLEWRPVDGDRRDPSAWGELVLSRADSGEILFVDPELFWERVHRWFRSRGVDYNT